MIFLAENKKTFKKRLFFICNNNDLIYNSTQVNKRENILKNIHLYILCPFLGKVLWKFDSTVVNRVTAFLLFYINIHFNDCFIKIEKMPFSLQKLRKFKNICLFIE